MKERFHRPMPENRACRISTEIIVALPVSNGPNGSRTKTAPAIGTHVVESVFDTRTAEGAFKAADHRVHRIWRKRSIAVFANRSQFEHNSGSVSQAQDAGRSDTPARPASAATAITS